MKKPKPLPVVVYDTEDSDFPTLHEIGDALRNVKPKPTFLQSDIWRALQTIKKHGHHRLIITILGEPPTGRRCISSDLDDGYRIERGILYGTQRIDICPNVDICGGGKTDTVVCEGICSVYKSEHGMCRKEKPHDPSL